MDGTVRVQVVARSVEERVVWLRQTVVRLRAIAAELQNIADRADDIFEEVAGGADVSDPDPLADFTVLLGGPGDGDVASDVMEMAEEIKRRQPEIEARLCGRWRPEWSRPVTDRSAESSLPAEARLEGVS
jgi:hypothetical protein